MGLDSSMSREIVQVSREKAGVTRVLGSVTRVGTGAAEDGRNVDR